jgi:hypothetical protein
MGQTPRDSSDKLLYRARRDRYLLQFHRWFRT